jgi:hypothetical protein
MASLDQTLRTFALLSSRWTEFGLANNDQGHQRRSRFYRTEYACIKQRARFEDLDVNVAFCRIEVGPCKEGAVALAIWLLWGGLTMSLALPLLNWPVMFILAGSFIAAALVCVSIAVPKIQLEQAPKSFRYALILAVSLGFGMILQTVPLKLTGLANPLWSAMGAAIGQPTAGYITVDVGSTVVALAKYLVILGAGLTVALSCANQMRSAQMSSAIARLLTIFCVACLVMAGVDEFHSAEIKERFWAEWINLSMLGVLTTASIMVRFRRRFGSKLWPTREHFRSFAAWVAMIALFAIPLFAQRTHAAAIPTVCAISTLLAVVFVKRLASGLAGVLFAVALVICGLWLAGVTTGIVGPRSSEVLGSRSEAEIATVIRDFRWFGSGIGTYSRVVPMYADLQDVGKGLLDSAPTALSLLIELGLPLTLLAAILLLALAWAVCSMVARSDRDYSEAMLACSTLVYVVAAAFTPRVSLSFPTMVVSSIMIGLGLTAAERPLGTPGVSHSRSTVRPPSARERVGSSRSKVVDVPAPQHPTGGTRSEIS